MQRVLVLKRHLVGFWVLCALGCVQPGALAHCDVTHTMTSSQLAYALATPRVIEVDVFDSRTPGAALVGARMVDDQFVASAAGPSDTQVVLTSRPTHPVVISVGCAGSRLGGVASAGADVTVAPEAWSTPTALTVDVARQPMQNRVRVRALCVLRRALPARMFDFVVVVVDVNCLMMLMGRCLWYCRSRRLILCTTPWRRSTFPYRRRRTSATARCLRGGWCR